MRPYKPAFHKRHYQLMADMLHKGMVHNPTLRNCFYETLTVMVDMFKSDNDQFKEQKFREAAEYGVTKAERKHHEHEDPPSCS